MKVLYFMTTPPLHEAYTEMVKGLEAYESYFRDNDIVWAGYNATVDRVNILGKPVAVVSIPEPPYVLADIFEQLPDGWEPDIIFFNNADGITLAEDFWDSPYPMACIANDLHVGSLHNPDVYNLFDAVAAITPMPERIKHQGFFYIPCCTSHVPDGVPPMVPFSDRPVDVLSVCSKLLPVYMDRNRTLGHLATELGDRYTICFPSLHDLDIHTPHRFAKIVVDRTFLNLSGRAYEAILNGCLYFCHEENNLIENNLEPFVHYIPYNDENIVELVERYLTDEKAATTVIEAAYAFFEGKAHTHGEMYNDLLDTALTVADIEKRQQRAKAMTGQAKASFLATNLASYLTYWKIPKPAKWQERYWQLSDTALSGEKDTFASVRRLLEAGRVAHLTGDLAKAESMLARATDLDAEYGWPWALRAQIALAQDRFSDADAHADMALSVCEKFADKTARASLPLSVDQGWLQWLAWGSYFRHHDPAKNHDHVKAARAVACKVKTQVALRNGDEEDALASLETLVRELPILREEVMELVCLLQKRNDLERALSKLETGLACSPYSYMLLEKKIELLQALGKEQQAVKAENILAQVKRCYSRETFFELTGLKPGNA